MTFTLLGIVTDFKSLQPEKAELLIDVILSGISMEVKPLLKKALSPIDVTLFGIAKEVKPLQPQYLQPVVFQQILNKTVERW